MTNISNPYQSPKSDQARLDKGVRSVPLSWKGYCLRVAIWLAAYLYPVWLVGSFYMVWFIAWAELGHRPRPMIDDPKSIGGMMTVFYYFPGILLMLLPVLTPLGLGASFFCPFFRNGKTRYAAGAVLSLVYVLLCTIAVSILRQDKQQIVEWWFD